MLAIKLQARYSAYNSLSYKQSWSYAIGYTNNAKKENILF